jgi:hypothetical protein
MAAGALVITIIISVIPSNLRFQGPHLLEVNSDLGGDFMLLRQ